ncbi:MAG: SRPBCC domain-containing protein [Aggregatilineales bacterium]
MTVDAIQEQVAIFERTLNVPAEQVYTAFTNADALTHWLCNFSATTAQVGGAVFLSWNNGYYVSGEFMELEANSTIKLSWFGRGDDAPSKVKIHLKDADGATHITVKHKGIAPENAYDWDGALENLQAVLEASDDLRLSRRAILGVIPTAFNATIAEQIGVPVTEGFRISGTVPASGAESAGLQADDVFVEINGSPIKRGQDVAIALTGGKVGDEVAVKLYRGQALIDATFPLSPMPLPKLPETLTELADQMAEVYATLDNELQQVFAGVSAEVAATPPAEREWSANETVAHLINTERWMQEFIGCSVNGQVSTGFSAHIYERSVALAQIYGGKDSLLAEMRRSQGETIALIRALPASTEQTKNIFNAIGTTLVGMPNHNRQHFAQMKNAIEAAK